MRIVPRLVYLACFIGLGAAAATALNGACEPSMSADLLRAVAVAAICASPGLFHPKLWPLVFVLLPLGCYLILRTTIPLPMETQGFSAQFEYFGQQLRTGATAYRTAVFPLPVNDYPGLQLLLAFSLYWLAAGAAFLALSLRRPVAAVVLLLVVAGYSLTVDEAPRALWPALVFAVLAVCLIVICRGLSRESWRLRDAVAGGAVGIAGSLVAFALLTAAPSVAATPWQDWRMWDPFGVGSSTYTFNWLQNYPRLLDPANDHPVMRVESPLPCYWRASSLDSFTGDGWVTSQAFLLQLEATEETDGLYTYLPPDTELMPPGVFVNEAFEVWGFQSNYFLTGGDPRSLVIDRQLPVRMNSMRALRVSTPLEPTFEYAVEAVVPVLEPVDLVGSSTDHPEELDRYLLLPFGSLRELSGVSSESVWIDLLSDYGPNGWEWADLYALNQRIIGDATDPYHKTLRIERYLRQFYIYSLDPPESDYSSPYSAFLFDTRAGYCQHYAGAMAILLRFNGIPARVALGFTAGEKQGQTDAYVVSWNNAHAWVEAYFGGVGWVMFDPTPGRNIPFPGASSTTPGFISPFTETTTPRPDTPTTSEPRPVTTERDETAGGPVTSGGKGWLHRYPWAPWVMGLAAIAAGWPVARGLWKQRRLYRGRPEERLEASLALLRADLRDYGAPATPAHTLEETLTILQGYLGLQPDPGLVERTEAVLYGGRRARSDDVERAEALRAQVRHRLRKRHGWIRTLFAWYGVPHPVHRRT